MKTDPRSRHLAFALKIRKLTDALIELVEDGARSPGLDASLREVLTTLETGGGPTSVRLLKKRGPFAHYENVVTLREVVKPEERNVLINKLNSVIEANSEEETENSALEAIKFFDALESRALYHHNHPPAVKRAVLQR